MRDNPARRLHDVLVSLKAQPASQPIRDAWAAVLGIDVNDGVLMFTAMAEVSAIPDEIRGRLLAVPNLDAELYLSWDAEVRAVLAGFIVMTNPVDGIQRLYTDATLLGLRHASNVLRAAGRDLPADQLAELLTEIGELIALLDGSDEIPADLRMLLLDLAEEMRRAARLLKIHGVDGLERAVAQCIGSIKVKYPAGVPEDVQSTGVWAGFFKLVSNVGLMLGTASTAYELGSSVAGAIST